MKTLKDFQKEEKQNLINKVMEAIYSQFEITGEDDYAYVLSEHQHLEWWTEREKDCIEQGSPLWALKEECDEDTR